MTLRNHVHRKSRAYARERKRFMRGVEPGLYEATGFVASRHLGPSNLDTEGGEMCENCPYCVERCGDDEEAA